MKGKRKMDENVSNRYDAEAIQITHRFDTLTNKVKNQDYIFPFGKYKGEYVADVKMEDIDYLLWMRDNLREEDNKELLDAINWHLDND